MCFFPNFYTRTDVSSLVSRGRGARLDKCVRAWAVSGHLRHEELFGAALQQLSFLDSLGPVESVLRLSQDIFPSQAVFPSAREMEIASFRHMLDCLQWNYEKELGSVQEPAPRLLWACHSTHGWGRKATCWVLLHLLVCQPPPNCMSHRNAVWFFPTAWTGCYQKGLLKPRHGHWLYATEEQCAA